MGPQLYAIGAIVNSALYLGGCLVVGLHAGNKPAIVFALAAFGATYIAYAAQVTAALNPRLLWPRALGDGANFVAAGWGAASGLSLLFGGI